MTRNNQVRKTVKPFFMPPSLVATQAASICYFGRLTRWRGLLPWLLKGIRTLPTAAGAVGMGCIGFPIHPVWEVTAACNLKCRHCHVNAGKSLGNELNTEEGKRLILDIAKVPEFRMLVFTGGEPLVRPDILELVRVAADAGLTVSIATNATLIDTAMARKMKQAGVCNVAVGLDGCTPQLQDFIRNTPGTFERTMRGISASREAGMCLQINITVMQHNYDNIPQLLDLADEVEAQIVLLYQVVPQGRGNGDGFELSKQQYAELIKYVAARQKTAIPVIEPTCSPHYWAYLLKSNGNGKKPGLAEKFFRGCSAGWGLCYVKPDGEVWPCPFVPVSGGNIRDTSIARIWHEGEPFRKLQARHENLTGRCSTCQHERICGGCRGRAYSSSGDYLGDDPLCFLHDDDAAV